MAIVRSKTKCRACLHRDDKFFRQFRFAIRELARQKSSRSDRRHSETPESEFPKGFGVKCSSRGYSRDNFRARLFCFLAQI